MAHAGRKNADEALALALARGLSVRAAAKVAGVSERTAGRRQTDPAFRQRVAELRGGLIAAAAGRLAASMSRASAALLRLLDSADETVRLRAAARILEHGVRVGEAAELRSRIEELERRLGEQPK